MVSATLLDDADAAIRELDADWELRRVYVALGLCVICGVRWITHTGPGRQIYCHRPCTPSGPYCLPEPPSLQQAPTYEEAAAMLAERGRRRRERERQAEAERQAAREARPLRGLTGLRPHLPELIKRQHGICPLCDRPLPLDQALEDSGDTIHVDHILPRLHGGGDAIENLQATHAFCNLSKGSRAAH